jgi:predicted amidohydrolase
MSGATSRPTIRVALAQVDCALGDIGENARRARAAIAEAKSQQADLIVFPELNLTGYALGAVGEDLALAADDEVIADLAAAAGEIDVVLGFVEDGPVHSHNSAVYLAGGRPLRVQRKVYLPSYGRFEEHKHFSPGQSVQAFDSRFGRLALLICNDAWQPPLPFLSVHDGARVLIVPACSSLEPDAGTDPGNEDDWGELLRFHARFLESYVIFVNRVGTEAGLKFWGGSRVVDPWGRLVAEAPKHEPALVIADLDLRAVRTRRREMPLLKEGRLGMLAREFARLVDGEV